MVPILLIVGAALGVGCGLLLAWALRRQSMAAGLGSVIVSFLLISAAAFAVRAIARELVVPFGVITVLAFLGAAVAAALGKR